jgi:hypothetical protein
LLEKAKLLWTQFIFKELSNQEPNEAMYPCRPALWNTVQTNISYEEYFMKIK